MNYIYEIRNIKTNKRYIGRTNNPKQRKKRHFWELKKGKHHCIYLQRSYDKYGSDNFIFNVLCEIESFDESCDLEEYYLNSGEELYNTSKNSTGGDLISYHPNRAEIVEKISQASKIMWNNMTDEEKKQYGENIKGDKNPNFKNRGKNSPLYGIKLSEEHRRKIGVAQKGKIISDETKQKLSHSKKGCKAWNKGLKTGALSEETKKKISDSLKGKETPQINKAVICEGYYFKTVKQSAKAYNISSMGIITRIKSKTEKWKEFYYFNKESDCIDNYIIYKDGCNFESKLTGITKQKKVYCEGEILTVQEALEKYNMKSANALKYRCDSKKDKWENFHYID